MTSPAGDRERLERALHDPAAAFDAPAEVLREPGWSREDKQRVLEQWRLDAQRLEESAGENMAGGEPSRLREVVEALGDLDG